MSVFLALSGAAHAQLLPEDLRGEIALLLPSNLTLYGQAADFNNPFNNTFQVEVCWDDPTFTRNCDRKVTANTIGYPYTTCLSCVGFNYTPPAGTVGSVTPRDGKPHLMYVKMISQQSPGSADRVLDGSPWPFTYKNGTAAAMWAPNLESSPTRLTPSQLAVFANRNDPYSVGSAGTVVCTVGGVSIKNDGAVGYFVQSHNVPCSNIRLISTPVTSAISQNAFNSAILPSIQGLPSTIQAIALGWAQPSIVTPSASGYSVQSISGVVAHGGMVTGGACYSTGSGLGSGPINPYFNSPSQTPFTDYGLRPTMMLAAEVCPLCTLLNTYGFPWSEDFHTLKAVIDAAVRGINSNPIAGNVDWAWTNDLGRSITAILASPLSMGTALSPLVHGQVLGSLSAPTSTTVSAQNVLLYDQASATWPYSNPGFVPGAGIAFAVTSTSGFLPFDGNQTNAASWLSHGAIAAFGNAVEPCGLFPYKSPDPAVLIPHYTQGQTAIEALWKSVRMPWQGNFVGDPLAAPFRLAAGTSNPPTLTSLSPASLLPGTSTKVTFTGTNFSTPVSISLPGSGISVSNTAFVSATSITATITVAKTVAPGSYPTSVTSAGKTTGSVPLTVASGVPTLTSLSPATANQGTSITTTLTGTNFASGATLKVSGSGVAASNVTVVSSTQLTATLTVGSAAAIGNYSIAVTTAAGTTGTQIFTVKTASSGGTSTPPHILSLTPASAAAGSTTALTITGTGFTTDATLTLTTDAASFSNIVVVNPTTITATIQIKSTAVLGPRQLGVKQASGISNTATFTFQ